METRLPKLPNGESLLYSFPCVCACVHGVGGLCLYTPPKHTNKQAISSSKRMSTRRLAVVGQQLSGEGKD